MTIPRLTAEQQAIVDTAKAVGEEFKTTSRQFDAEARFPFDHFERLRETGLLKVAVPKEYGGSGTPEGNPHVLAYLVTEAISRGCSTTGWNLIIHYHNCGNIARHGSHEQKTRILGDVAARGAIFGSIGSEVNHRQRAAAKNTARKLVFQAEMKPVSGGFITSGSKHFCSNAPVADYLMYWSIAPGTHSHGEGLVMSVVTKGSPGLTFSEHAWDKVSGLRGSVSWSAELKDVFIPWSNVLGQPGDYIHKDPYTLELSQAFHLIGAAQGAFDYILGMLRDRPFLQDEAGLMVLVGDLSSQLQAARGSAFYANALWEQKQFGEAALASLYTHHTAREMALTLVSKAYDIVGTRALFSTDPLDLISRDVRTASLHTRDSQLLELAANGTLQGDFAPKQKYGALSEKAKTWSELGLQPDLAA